MGSWVGASMSRISASVSGKLNYRGVDGFMEVTEVLIQCGGFKHKPVIASKFPRNSFERPKCCKKYIAGLFARDKTMVGRD